MDPEALKQIVKAITSLHDGRTWKPETAVALLATLVAASAAVVTFLLGKRQIDSAQEIARMSVLTPMRQEWVDQVRMKIARHMSGCVEAFVQKGAHRPKTRPLSDTKSY